MRLSPVAATRLVSGAFLGGALLGALLVVAGAYVLAFGPVTDRLPAVAAVLGGGGEGGCMLLVWAALKRRSPAG